VLAAQFKYRLSFIRLQIWPRNLTHTHTHTVTVLLVIFVVWFIYSVPLLLF